MLKLVANEVQLNILLVPSTSYNLHYQAILHVLRVVELTISSFLVKFCCYVQPVDFGLWRHCCFTTRHHRIPQIWLDTAVRATCVSMPQSHDVKATTLSSFYITFSSHHSSKLLKLRTLLVSTLRPMGFSLAINRG